MVWCAKLEKKKAEAARRKIIAEGLFNHNYPVTADENYVYVPLTEKNAEYSLVDRRMQKKKAKPKSLADALAKVLTKKEMEKLVTSFDVIGDIAIIEIPKELAKKERQIGEALLETHPNLKTVCRRAGVHAGEFRVRAVKVIAGEKRTQTPYRESGTVMRLDVAKVYFTPRLSHERERIAKLVKPGEKVAVFFAGVGPFALVIAKHQPKAKIYAVELNPIAVRFLEENIRVNKMQEQVIPMPGDVRKVAAKLPKFDRIMMPLPKGAADFLDTAITSAKEGGVIHFYQFAREEDLFSVAISKVEAAAEKLGRKVKIFNKKVVRPYAPRVYQIVIDFSVHRH